MAVLGVNATRMELGKLKERLVAFRKGHRLLKNKCDGMQRHLIKIEDQVAALRREVEAGLNSVFLKFEAAKAQTSSGEVDLFVSTACKKKLLVDFKKVNFMGVGLPSVEAKGLKLLDNLQHLLFQGSSFFVDSARQIAEILPRLIMLAQKEKSVNILRHEIRQTRRRVNALEFLVIPNCEDTIKSISLKLEENERGNIARLSRVRNKKEF